MSRNSKSNVVKTVKKSEPHPTEAIVLQFDYNKVTPDDVRKVFENVKSEFPNNKVLAMPDYLSLQSCSKDVLENIISMISEIIDTLPKRDFMRSIMVPLSRPRW